MYKMRYKKLFQHFGEETELIIELAYFICMQRLFYKAEKKIERPRLEVNLY